LARIRLTLVRFLCYYGTHTMVPVP